MAESPTVAIRAVIFPTVTHFFPSSGNMSLSISTGIDILPDDSMPRNSLEERLTSKWPARSLIPSRSTPRATVSAGSRPATNSESISRLTPSILFLFAS